MTERLCKKDVLVLVHKLQQRGFVVEHTASRVCAYRTGTCPWEYVCGFYWSQTARAWRFDSSRPFVHTYKCLDIALEEYDRERQTIIEAEEAFQQWKASASQKRWRRYLGFLAKFYLRQM